MGKHTPGPWRWEVNKNGFDIRLQGDYPPGPMVMTFRRWGRADASPSFRNEKGWMNGAYDFAVQRVPHHVGWDMYVDHPDARLIAAAPDLLDAAKAALDWMKSTGASDAEFAHGAPVNGDIRVFVNAAIAKAEGGGADGHQ